MSRERERERDGRIEIFTVGKNIQETLNKVGYPFKSKEHSQKVYEWKRGIHSKSHKKYFHFLESDFQTCPQSLMYQIEEGNNLNISHKCCYEFKKKPILDYQKQSGRKITITGMMKAEGGQRTTLNCIVSDKDGKIKKFHPLSVITEEFENWYISERKIKLCDLYYPPFNFERTGCKGCPYSYNLQAQLDIMAIYLPAEKKQCELIWKPVYDEYRRLGYRLSKSKQMKLF